MIRRLYSLLVVSAQPLLRRKLRRRGLAEPGYLEHVEERFGPSLSGRVEPRIVRPGWQVDVCVPHRQHGDHASPSSTPSHAASPSPAGEDVDGHPNLLDCRSRCRP